MAVNVFLTSTTVVLKHFAEGSQIQSYEFFVSRTKEFYHKTIDTFCFIVLTMSVTPNFRGVTERHCPSKGILSRSRNSDINFLQSINFAYGVGIISSYSNRICYRIAKSRTKDGWELHAALRTVFENHCSTSNTTPASYHVTALAIIKPKKHKRLPNPLLQSGVITHNNRVQCAIKSTRKSIWQNR